LLKTTEFARAHGCRKTKKMTNSTNVSDVKMTRFGYRVDLIRERHVRVSGVTTPGQLWAMPRLPFGLPRLPCPKSDKTFYVKCALHYKTIIFDNTTDDEGNELKLNNEIVTAKFLLDDKLKKMQNKDKSVYLCQHWISIQNYKNLGLLKLWKCCFRS
jgi:hypothetical protein